MGLVLFDHFFIKNEQVPPSLHHFLMRLVPFTGTTGVISFFVISGYLITTLLLREEEKRGSISLGKFYARRFLRIFPPFYVYLLLTGLLLVAAGNWSGVVARDYLVSGLYLQNLWGGKTAIVAHTWSLSIEEQFYIVWPGLLILLGRRKSIPLVASIMLGWPLLRVLKNGMSALVDPRYALEVAAVDTILWGVILALLLKETAPRAFLLRLSRSPWTFWLALLTLFAEYSAYPLLSGLPVLFLTPVRNLAITCIIWWCINNAQTRLGRVLETRPMTHLGILSYSLYLWQQPFYTDARVEAGSWWLSLLVNLTLALAAAHASYFLLEKPLLSWRDRLRLPG